MKGVILDFSVEEKTGFISGDDGNRYSFTATEWKGTRSANKGDTVNFDSGVDNNVLNVQFDETVADFAPKKVSETWQIRFDFYDKYGLYVDKNPEFKKGFKALSFNNRMRLQINWWGFLFGIFYYLYLGLWKKALVLLPFSLVIAVFFPIPWLGFTLLYAASVNVAYYIKCRRNLDSWNAFEGWITKIKS